MDNFSFYKSIYDRELARRNDLNNSVNIPITLLVIIVGINSYNFKKISIDNLYNLIQIENILIIVIGLLFIISILYLIKSYNNFFRGFDYKNLAETSKIRNFEIIQIPEYNDQVEKELQLDFEVELIDKINALTDNHIMYNDQRGLDLYKAKTFTIITLLVTVIELLIISII